jgi:hypothetical protein
MTCRRTRVGAALARRGAAVVAALVVMAVAPVSAGTTTTIDAGRLAQTTAEPSDGAALNAQMAVLWRAIEQDNVALARTVFFPESAYISMKTGMIPDPSDDFIHRLIGFYDLDIGAYHRLVESGGPSVLVRVEANRADAAWIGPRDCENLIGYWHLPGVRLVYRHGAKVDSVAVDSLISWRGVWYVVHLGPNPRFSDAGVVDGFSAGPGVPGPAGGC